MGGNVIYLPQTPNLGTALGSGISQGLSNYAQLEMKRMEQEQDMQGTMAAINAVKQAGSRDKALEIITNPAITKFRDPQQLAQARLYVDTIYPAKDETPTLVKGYSSTTGDNMEAYVPKNRLYDNNAVLRALGPGATLTKPDLVDFFMSGQPGQPPISLGRRPRTDQQPGEYTKEQLDLQMASQRDQRAAEAADRAIANQKDQTAVQARQAAADERANSGLRIRSQNAAMGYIADSLNIKKTTGLDGMINFNLSESDPEAIRQFRKAAKLVDGHLDKNKDNALDAANKAMEQVGIGAKDNEPPAPAPTPKPKEGGAISKAATAIANAVTGKSNSNAIVEPPADQSKREVGKVYKTPAGNKKWTAAGWVSP